MKKFRFLSVIFGLMTILACTSPSGGGNDLGPGTLQVSVDGTLLTGTEINFLDGIKRTLEFSMSDGSPVNLRYEVSDSYYVNIDRSTNSGELELTYDLPSYSTNHTSNLYIYNYGSNERLASYVLNCYEAPYISINHSWNNNAEHGDEVNLYISSNFNSNEFDWTSGDPTVVSIDVPTESRSYVTLRCLKSGTSTITAVSQMDSSVQDSFTFTVEPRSISVTFQSSNILNHMFVGETFDLNDFDLLEVSYTYTPDFTITEPSNDLTVVSSNSTIVSVNGSTITALGTGDVTLTISPTYNPDESRELNARVVATSSGLSLSGNVVDGPGSYAVSGTTVSLYKDDSDTVLQSAVTTADGGFTFTGLTSGFYTLEASMSGKAASRIEHIYLDSSDRKITIVQKDVSLSFRPVVAPALEMSLSDRLLVEDYIIEMTASLGSGTPISNSGNRFSLAYYVAPFDGQANLEEAVTTEDSLDILYRVDDNCEDGELYELIVVGYDNNNNRIQYNLPFLADSNNSEFSILQPGTYSSREVKIVSTTLGSDVNLYSAVSGSNHYVDVYVEYYTSSYDAVNIYRRTGSSGAFSLVGHASAYQQGSSLGLVSGSWYHFKDSSAILYPGETYEYCVAYIYNGHEGALSDPIPVTVLPKYNIELLTPSDSAVLSGIATMTWQESNKDALLWAGLTIDSRDSLMVVTADGASLAYADDITDGSLSYSLPMALNSGQRYEWDIASVRSLSTDTGNTYTTSESYSFPRAPIYSPMFSAFYVGNVTLPLSSNGSYSFYQE